MLNQTKPTPNLLNRFKKKIEEKDAIFTCKTTFKKQLLPRFCNPGTVKWSFFELDSMMFVIFAPSFIAKIKPPAILNTVAATETWTVNQWELNPCLNLCTSEDECIFIGDKFQQLREVTPTEAASVSHFPTYLYCDNNKMQNISLYYYLLWAKIFVWHLFFIIILR